MPDFESQSDGPHEKSRRKQEVGRRLALAARVVQYSERGGLVADGPSLSSVQQMSGGAILGFDVGSADGLHLSGSPRRQTASLLEPGVVREKTGDACVHIRGRR